MLDHVSDGSRQHFLVVGFSIFLGLISFQHLGSFDHGSGRYLDTLLLELIDQSCIVIVMNGQLFIVDQGLISEQLLLDLVLGLLDKASLG